jgi:hypothetical protein
MTAHHRTPRTLYYCKNIRCRRLLRYRNDGTLTGEDGYCATDARRRAIGYPMIGWTDPGAPEPPRMRRGPARPATRPESSQNRNLKDSSGGYLGSVGIRATISPLVHIIFPEGI